MPYSGGLTRNIVQCLEDNGIPLYLSTTVTKVHGTDRVEGVTVAEVDAQRRPIPETARFIECDTVLLSCGLIPENELSAAAGVALDRVTNGAVVDQFRETSLHGVFACGNVLHVHDLVDYVSEEAEIAGRGAARFLQGAAAGGTTVEVHPENGVRYAVPQRIDTAGGSDVTLYFRVADVYRDVTLQLRDGDKVLAQRRRPKVAPGEMETLTLKAADLPALSGDLTLTMIRKDG
jgi:NAD(P)H-nitrite reductase large subunit